MYDIVSEKIAQSMCRSNLAKAEAELNVVESIPYEEIEQKQAAILQALPWANLAVASCEDCVNMTRNPRIEKCRKQIEAIHEECRRSV